MAHPVTAAQEFFQKAGQTGPDGLVYEFSDYCTDTPIPEKRFVCSLKTPRVVSTEQGIVRCVLEENVFQGEGRKKADAKRDAAAAALAFLQQQPLWEAQHRLPSLRDVLAACFTNQGILQDPDLKAWWAYCQQYPLSADTPTAAAAAAAGSSEAVPMTGPVSLPLTALTHSKHLLGWIKQQQQQVAQGSGSGGLDVTDSLQLMWHIQGLLHEAAASGTLLEGVSVDSHGLSVSRQQQQQQRQSGAAGASGVTQHSREQDAAAASAPVPSRLDHEVWDESPTAVLVPADIRSAVSQVQLHSPAGTAAAAAQGSPDLLHQVAALLHLPQAQSLVVWGRVGPRVSHPALPAEWAATQQQWERVHAALQQQQQQQQQQGKGKGQPEAPQGQDGGVGGGGGGWKGVGVLAHLSGGTSVLVGASKPQQQQQHGKAGGAGGGPLQPAVLLGTARQASASTLQHEPQPPKKRLHTAAGEAEAGTAAAGVEASGAAGAAEPSSVTSLSRASLLAVGGGPAVMDWEGSTKQGAEEVKGPLGGTAQSILPPDTSTDSDAAAAAGGGSSSSQGPHMVDIDPPVMYSAFYPDQGSAEAAGLNLRASWLAGRRVYGPVLLAGSGIMRGAGTHNVVKWRSYTADTFWAAVSGLLPAAAHSSRAAHGGCTLTRLPAQYRSTCWLGAHPRHLLETYTTKHSHWLNWVCPHLPSLQQQQQQQAAAAGEGEGSSLAGGSSGAMDKLPALMGYTISVEDAAEPASNSPTGFNCRAQLRVYPVAATAAAAAGSSGSSSGRSVAGSWLRALGCSSEAAGLVVLENLSVAVGSQVGPCAAEAHAEVQEGQLVVVADSGLALGPVDAQNIAALAALHLLTALEAAALTGTRPEPPTTAGTAAAATEAAAAELEALAVAAETEAEAAAAAAAAPGAAEELLAATAGTADVAAAAVDTAVAAAGGVETDMEVDGGGGAGSLGDVEVLWSAPAGGGDADGAGLLQPAVGRVAKINAHLYLPTSSSSTAPAGSQLAARPSDPGCYSLDVLRCYSLLLGSGAVAGQVEALVMGLRVGGAAQMRVHVCLQGSDLLHRLQPVEALLAVHLLEVTLPKPSTAAAAAAGGGAGGGEGAAGPALFDPPLGLQRRRLVSELVRRCNMGTVVDLGCGDGGLMKHLLCEAGFSALGSIVGVDVSARELAAAARRLQGMQSHWMALQPSSLSPPAAAAGGGVSAGGGCGGTAGAAAPAGAAEGPAAAAAGYEGEGSTVSGLGAPVGRLASTAVSFEAQSRRQQDQSQDVAGMTLSEGVSVIQGTADSFTGNSGDSSRQQQQQQQQGLSAARVPSDGTSCAIQLQLLQGDLTSPGLASPSSGCWQACGLNPGSVDLAACIEVLEHLEPQAVDALGHSVLGGLRPKAAVFSTPNWEYNMVLRGINAGVTWPGPPGRDGQPLRHGEHRFEWTRAEFRAWAAALAGQHGYSVEFVDIGRALREQEVLAAAAAAADGGRQDTQQQQQQQAGSAGAVEAAAAEARAAGTALDASGVVLSALPSVTAAAGPYATAAAQAAAAAVMQGAAGSSAGAAAVEVLERVAQAGEQQGQQQQALVAGLAGGDTNAERQRDVFVMQDPFQDPFQQASLGPGSLGGASQAAIFRLLLPEGDAGDEARGVGGGAEQQAGGGLSVFWGPMTALLRVGSFQGAGEMVVGAEDSGVLATVEAEHF